MMRLTCVLAVAGARNSAPAISSLLIPVATSLSTSVSRSVSAFSRGLGSGRATRPANSPMSLRVTFGEISASPSATTRTAWISSSGSVSFTRKPLAPALSAR